MRELRKLFKMQVILIIFSLTFCISTALNLFRQGRQAFQDDTLSCHHGQGFYPHPKDCRFFYRCWLHQNKNFQKFVFTCPHFTVFDPNENVCRALAPTENCDSNGIKNNNIEGSNTNNVKNTQKPYHINDNINQKTTKPHRNIYNNAIQMTTEKSPSLPIIKFTTVKPTTLSTTPMTPSPPPPTTAQPSTLPTTLRPSTQATTLKPTTTTEVYCEKVGFYRNPKNCSQFFQCFDHGHGHLSGIVFDCPDGLYFKETLPQECVRPEMIPDADCEDTM